MAPPKPIAENTELSSPDITVGAEHLLLAISGTQGRAVVLREEPDPEGACVVFGLELTEEDWKLVFEEFRGRCLVVGDAQTIATFGDRNSTMVSIDELEKAPGARLVHEEIVVRVRSFSDAPTPSIVASLEVGGASVLLGWYAPDQDALASLTWPATVTIGPFESLKSFERECLGELVYTVHPGSESECGSPRRTHYHGWTGPLWMPTTSSGVTAVKLVDGEAFSVGRPMVGSPYSGRCAASQVGYFWDHQDGVCAYDSPNGHGVTDFLICQAFEGPVPHCE